MAQEKINLKLEKRIISNKTSNDFHDKVFNKLAKSNEYVDEEKIKSLYEDLFYNIPTEGRTSHKNIIEQSSNYIFHNYFNNIKNQQKTTITAINELYNKLTNLENPINSNENPLYENGSFLIAGENGQKYQDMDTVYVMQEGRKRVIHSVEVFLTIRRALNLPEAFTGLYFVTVNELNSIPDGPDIHTTSDLLLEGNDLLVELEDIHQPSAYYDVKIYCYGNEIQDTYNYITTENDAAAGQFYLDNEGCTIKYLVDDYTTDDVSLKVETLNIPNYQNYSVTDDGNTNVTVGMPLTLRLLRRTEVDNNAIPPNISSLWQDPGTISYNGNEVSNYIRSWGPHGRYESIIYASGRLEIEEIPNAYIVNTEGGQDTSRKILNGLPTEGSGFWDVVPGAIEEFSTYGTKRIFAAGSGRWGALNQDQDLQEQVFDDLGNPYYEEDTYGQPIIRLYSRYWALLYCYCSTWPYQRQVVCKLLSPQGTHGISQGGKGYFKRKGFRDKTGANIDYKSNTRTIYGLKWGDMNKDRVKFVGLQDVQTNEYTGIGNVFNMSGNLGSNTELVGISLDYA